MVNPLHMKNQLLDLKRWHLQAWLPVLFISLIFTLAMLYNYITPLAGIFSDRDYALQVWDLWLVNESIIHGQNPYFTQLQYYPVGTQLGRHVLSPGFFPVTFVVYLLSGDQPLYPIYAYKVIILLSFSLMLTFSYLTLRAVGIGGWAATIAAIAYAFGDFYMHHMVRLHIMSGFFIPMSAFLVIRLYQQPSRLRLLACAALVSVGLYFTELTLYVYIAIFLLLLALIINPTERAALLVKVRTLGLKPFLTAVLLFWLIALPFVYHWLISDAEAPNPEEAFWYSSNLMGFFIPDPQTTPLYGTLFAGPAANIRVGSDGDEIFLGFPLLIFGLIGLVVTRQWRVRLVMLLALIFLLLSMGPRLKLFNNDTSVPLLYALIGSVPPFNVGRTPVRFVAMGFFLWMVVAAFGLHWVSRTVRPALATPLLLGLLLWTIAEVYTPTQPGQPYHIPPQLAQLETGPVIDLPLRYHNGWALLLQMFHHQPIATGYVSRNSPQQKAHFRTLSVVYEEALQTGSCDRFVEMGFRNIIIWPGVPDDVVAGLTRSECAINVVILR